MGGGGGEGGGFTEREAKLADAIVKESTYISSNRGEIEVNRDEIENLKQRITRTEALLAKQQQIIN